MAFPTTPTDGQEYTNSLGTVFKYTALDNKWNISSFTLTGATGIQGETGLAGLDGTDGNDGAAGADGATGLQGVPGPQGETGVAGADGSSGSQGETGAAGTDGGLNYWTPLAGAYSSDTQIKITDVSNAGSLQSKINRGTILKWSDGKQSMVTSSGYTGTDGGYVWCNTVGDTPLAGLTGVSYGYEKARIALFAMAGTAPSVATANIAGEFYAPFDMKIFGADLYVGTAGTTGPITIDINDDGTSMFTTKPSVAVSATTDRNNTADTGVVAADGSKLTVDVDANWNAADVYVELFYTPDTNKAL